MANYTTADIKALREKTGAGMLDVKKALDEANGDAEKAIEIIRVKGLKGIAKREGRAASAGLIAAKVVDSGNGQVGVLVEINAETDFVAKNQKFLDYAEQVLTAALDSGATDAEALAEGVNGFITKDESTENVAAALLRASRGEPVMSSRPTKMLVSAYQSEQKRATAEARIQELVNELPPRLRDIYTCLLEGLTNRRIARKLGISENTVRIYVSEVLHRLGHTSRTELIAAALGN